MNFYLSLVQNRAKYEKAENKIPQNTRHQPL